ncbi:hypothetical protein Vretifemale_19977 [Volvox reticuliferus]|uniref:Uncharacterized protein n=1 Tax=Volvox reticuliferus TaxID=1737510 RepID=A0A8J4CZT6_9CHLO|nr:hypothetical protein Vretifemale_19977 [Volvox reticuliferus]
MPPFAPISIHTSLEGCRTSATWRAVSTTMIPTGDRCAAALLTSLESSVWESWKALALMYRTGAETAEAGPAGERAVRVAPLPSAGSAVRSRLRLPCSDAGEGAMPKPSPPAPCAAKRPMVVTAPVAVAVVEVAVVA